MIEINDKKLVVVYIPAYNEEATLANVVNKIRENYSNNKKGYTVKIVVVDDGSKDKTYEIAKELKVDHITRHPRNMGLGAATRSGLRTALDMGADIAVKIDADFQHDPLDIDKVVRPILEDETDVCFGSRFKGHIKYKMPFYRRMGNAFFSYTTQIFTGLRVTDGQTGLIATNKRYLKKFRFFQDYNETQQMIIDAWRNQLRFKEVSVVFHERKHGKSFISFKYPFIVFPNIIRYFIHACPLKIFLPIGSLFLLLGLYTGFLVLTSRTKIFGDVSVMILLIAGIHIILYGLVADIISKKN